MIRIFAVLGGILTGLLLPAQVTVAAQHNDNTRQFIVRYAADQAVRIAALDSQERRTHADLIAPDGQRLEFVRSFERDGVVLRMPVGMTAAEASVFAAEMENRPEILSVVPDKRMYPTFTPSDARFVDQWYLMDFPGNESESAWDITRGLASVVIAILDTGYVDHQDLDPARKLPGFDFISEIFSANDGNGRDADASDPGDATSVGDCTEPGGPVDPTVAQDSSWHGMAITGVIGAFTDNVNANATVNIAGMDHRASLLPVRVLGRCGGSFSDIADAMRWSAGLSVSGVPDNPTPAKVLNLSFSGTGPCNNEEQSAINTVRSQGVVVVVSAGNDAEDVAGHSPANCDGVIVVGATARDGGQTDYTNFGEEVDISAPIGDGGDGVLALSNTGADAAIASPGGDAVVVIQGTSFSSAQVTAAVALMFAIDPNLTVDVIEDVLKASAADFPVGTFLDCQEGVCGEGILDVRAAVIGAQDPTRVIGAANSVVFTEGGGCALGDNTRQPDVIWILFFILLAWRLVRAGAHRC